MNDVNPAAIWNDGYRAGYAAAVARALDQIDQLLNRVDPAATNPYGLDSADEQL